MFRETQRHQIAKALDEAAAESFGDDHEINVYAVAQHVLDTRSLSVGETYLLGSFLVWAAEAQPTPNG